jgi:Ca2+-binding EF-hand superfamily protein
MALRRFASGSIGLLAFAAFVAPGARAGDAQIHSENNIFISPAGKPFRAPKDKPYPVVDWFAAADADHDGKLTKAEFRADCEAFFHDLDINKDGIIDSREIAYYEKITAPEIIATFQPDAGVQGVATDPDGMELPERVKEVPQGGAWFGFFGEPEPVAADDVNFDGKITYAEFMKSCDERWALLDPKKKGFLTLQDLPMTPMQARLPKQRPHKK